jgi:hypothetical protein
MLPNYLMILSRRGLNANATFQQDYVPARRHVTFSHVARELEPGSDDDPNHSTTQIEMQIR